MNTTKAQLKNIIKSGVPLLLEGPTGTGKTYIVQELAKEAGKTLHVIDVSGELTIDSILGQQTLIEGNVVWHDGTGVTPMKRGDWVMYNELNTALPEVLSIINGMLDDQRAVTLPNADNERVIAHEDFRFIATQNPSSGDYAGTGRLNEALLNRMVKVTMDYMEFHQEVDALKKHTKLVDSTVVQLVKLAEFTRKHMDDHLSTRDLVKILRLREKGGLSLRDSISTVVLSRYSDDEYRKIYEYHSGIMSELRAMDSEEKDPFETIKEKMADLRKREEEIAIEKKDVKTSVRKELLNDLLTAKIG